MAEQSSSSRVDLSNGVVRASDVVESMLSQIMPKIGEVGTQVQSLSTQLNEGFAKQDARIGSLEAQAQQHSMDLAEIFKRLTVVEGGVEKASKQVGEVAHKVELEESKPPPSLDERIFNRAPDPAAVRVSSEGFKTTFAKKSVQGMAEQFLKSAGIDSSELVVLGDETAKSYICRFAGTPGVAADRAYRFMSAMRGGDGQWIPCFGEDVEGGRFRAFWEVDKSKKMQRTEMLTKKLGEILSANCKGKVFARKKTGVVEVDFVEVAMVEVKSKEEVVLHWAEEIPREFAVRKYEVEKAFERLAQPRAKTQWL